MPFQFSTSHNPVLPLERASVLFDGIFSTPKLSHPEGVAIGPDGWIWAGNQDGDICRIAPDGSRMEKVASTGGFVLGLAFYRAHALFVCDLKHAAVFRLDLATGDLVRFTEPGVKIPNYPLVDTVRDRLFVSDSHASGTPGPGIWSYDLASGEGGLWYGKDLDFANGLAKRDGDDALYVCETFAPSITRIAIEPDGSAGAAETFAEDLPGLPDGIAFDSEGNLIVGCYEPSRLLRVSRDGTQTDVLIEDPTAHVLCHPTNIAFAGDRLYAANLGRWHISEVSMDIGADPLWSAA
ncbi:SMP-30/gluconolactonase/LRE family protein [Roseibium sp. MMSF_3412]|uniref:SMP-30/gluconolactonase/LRE family protein n=1 Tax=Roseibium sp. MMSF_3412 TaxID=3046712 RepID=UPI00273D6010|nr:SMP-30/gluconolactonase/LRE family protein [Roseibium sp. MMSF_3412]